MDGPLIFEDAEGRQYVEIQWLTERLRDIHFNNLGVGAVLDLCDEIEVYAEQNF